MYHDRYPGRLRKRPGDHLGGALCQSCHHTAGRDQCHVGVRDGPLKLTVRDRPIALRRHDDDDRVIFRRRKRQPVTAKTEAVGCHLHHHSVHQAGSAVRLNDAIALGDTNHVTLLVHGRHLGPERAPRHPAAGRRAAIRPNEAGFQHTLFGQEQENRVGHDLKLCRITCPWDSTAPRHTHRYRLRNCPHLHEDPSNSLAHADHIADVGRCGGGLDSSYARLRRTPRKPGCRDHVAPRVISRDQQTLPFPDADFHGLGSDL